MQWDYLNESPKTRRKDQIGWITSRVDDPAHTADVGVALDKLFADKEIATLSMDEHAFNASFLAGISVPVEEPATAASVRKLMELLEDHDDVKEVYSNAEFPHG